MLRSNYETSCCEINRERDRLNHLLHNDKLVLHVFFVYCAVQDDLIFSLCEKKLTQVKAIEQYFQTQCSLLLDMSLTLTGAICYLSLIDLI